MSEKRAWGLGAVVVVLAVVGGMLWMSEARKARIRDYTNFMTETHSRAISLYDDAEAAQKRIHQAMEKNQATPSDLARVKHAYQTVAEETLLEKEAFSQVVPPSEASSLQQDALAFLDMRVQRAETFARYFELAERRARGERVTDQQFTDVLEQAQKDQDSVMSLAKALRIKKDNLAVQ